MKSFTLVETIIVITIFSLTILALFGMIMNLYRTHDYSIQQATAIDEARRGIEKMVREIREAKIGEDGSYPIEYAGDKEFIFYADIDKDNEIERVRYSLGSEVSGEETKECIVCCGENSCGVDFFDFLTGGTLKIAKVKVSVRGFIKTGKWRYVDIFADGEKLGDHCKNEKCWSCNLEFQAAKVYDVTNQAKDNLLELEAVPSSSVDCLCFCGLSGEYCGGFICTPGFGNNYRTLAKFEFSWSETVPGKEHLFIKGVTDPSGDPSDPYPLKDEKISIISSYVRNTPPIFEYYDKDGNKIEENPARLRDTKVMKVYLVVNVDPRRAPQDFELESFVHLRNLKED